MKKIIILTIGLILIFTSVAFSASAIHCKKTGEFVCNVILDGEPVKEIDGIAVISFESEYQLLLKNNNDCKAVARITIDGSPISTFGGLVINANSEVILERYITESLERGKKFKFVPLDHPDIDDPSRKENGLIRVEFRLEKKQNYIILDEIDAFDWPKYPEGWLSPTNDTINMSDNFTTNCTNTSAEPGATIGGSESNQKFQKVDIELEDQRWVVEIRLKGIFK